MGTCYRRELGLGEPPPDAVPDGSGEFIDADWVGESLPPGLCDWLPDWEPDGEPESEPDADWEAEADCDPEAEAESGDCEGSPDPPEDPDVGGGLCESEASDGMGGGGGVGGVFWNNKTQTNNAVAVSNTIANQDAARVIQPARS